MADRERRPPPAEAWASELYRHVPKAVLWSPDAEGILSFVIEGDGLEEVEPNEDPDVVLRQSRRAELVLALITGALILAAVLAHGRVRLALGIASGLSAALLAWSLMVLALAEVAVHALRRRRPFPKSEGKGS